MSFHKFTPPTDRKHTMMPFGGSRAGLSRKVLVEAFINSGNCPFLWGNHTDPNDADKPRKRLMGPSGPREDYYDSVWGKMLRFDREEMNNKPLGKKARQYRRRFHGPYNLVLPLTRQKASLCVFCQ